MNDVVFIKGQGGLGRPLAGEDFVSGYIHYTAALPSGFSSNDRIKQVFSIDEAIALGITNTGIGETKATATITISAVGVDGDTVSVNVSTTKGVIQLGSYIKSATDTTPTILAASVVSMINAATQTHGYKAVSAAAVITLTVPIGKGLGGNSFTFANVFTGTITGASSSFTGGVASTIDIIYYHVKEYFAMQPQGNLYIAIYDTADVGVWSAVSDIRNYAQGKIRQLGIYQNTTAYVTTQSTSLQVAANLAASEKMPLEIFYQPDFSAASLSSLSDLRALNAPNVSVLIGQDGLGVGNDIWISTGKTVGMVGAWLGANSLAKVNESVAWVGKFDFSHVEFDTLAFANGIKYRTVSKGLLDNIDTLGYVFLIKHSGSNTGSYSTRPHTNVSVSSDYAFVQNNRTMNKAIRTINDFVIPQLSAPIFFNEDGTITEDSISFFETQTARALEQMQRDSEISKYLVTINPKQNVSTTNKLIIAVKILPVGVADFIQINIGFDISL
ncbi:MAG: DUF2586 family protein [Bacteroidia bacterium]